MNIRASKMRFIKLFLFLFILFSVLLCGISLRYINLFKIGIYGADVFFYWQMAYDWMTGHQHLSNHFRPFIYWLDSIAMSITGPNDWVLRALNVTLDSLTAFLIIYSGLVLRKSLILGLAIASTYLWLPMPLEMARTELVHTPSTFFLLLSFILLFKWLQTFKNLYLFLSGSFLGMSWSIHPDLAVLGASFTLVIGYKDFKSYYSCPLAKTRRILKDFLLYLAGYFSIFALFSLKFGPVALLANLLENQKAQSSGLAGTLLWRIFHFSHLYLSENLGIFLYILFIFSVGYLVWKMKKKIFTSFDLVLISFPICYLFFCALLFSRFELPRLLLPFVPLLLMFIFTTAYDLAKKYSREAVLLLSLICVGLNLKSYSMVMNQTISPYKEIHETFSPLLTEPGKLLIGPISFTNIHSPLSQNVYLDGRGVYLASTTSGSLKEILEEEKIRYIWIADVLYEPETFGAYLNFTYEERLLTLFNMTPNGYDVSQEKALLREFVENQNTVLIHKSKLGELYELK